MEKQNKKLTTKQEKLLCQYYDNECNIFSKMSAKLLLRTKKAQDFISQQQLVSNNIVNSKRDDAVNLWDKIENRIEQEEKAEFFLGKRSYKVEKQSRNWLPAGAMAGLAAAMLAIVVMQKDVANSPPKDVVAKTKNSSISRVNYTKEESIPEGRPIIIENIDSSDVLEVDWVRSGQGRVRVIDIPGSKSGIIWVRKNKPTKVRILNKRVPNAINVNR